MRAKDVGDAAALFRRQLDKVTREHGGAVPLSPRERTEARFGELWRALDDVAAVVPPFGSRPGVERELFAPDPNSGEIVGDILAHRSDRVTPLLVPFSIRGERIDVLDHVYRASDLRPAIDQVVHRLAEYYGGDPHPSA